MLDASELLLAAVSGVVGAIGGAAGANLGLRTKLTDIEHELWGVKGENGLKAEVIALRRMIEQMLQENHMDTDRIDKRNRIQHPPHFMSD